MSVNRNNNVAELPSQENTDGFLVLLKDINVTEKNLPKFLRNCLVKVVRNGDGEESHTLIAINMNGDQIREREKSIHDALEIPYMFFKGSKAVTTSVLLDDETEQRQITIGLISPAYGPMTYIEAQILSDIVRDKRLTLYEIVCQDACSSNLHVLADFQEVSEMDEAAERLKTAGEEFSLSIRRLALFARGKLLSPEETTDEKSSR